METYLVGGAVRDKLLGKIIKDRDWVVVGATPKDLLDQGFLQVGKDFPIFLHPETKEEYALALATKKGGSSVQDFYFSPNVTLEQDLARRDLTINAMAEGPDGEIIDPFHGKKDLESGTLRHISNTFSDDPLRVIRLARFMAKLSNDGFKVHEKTQNFVRKIVADGKLASLAPERVWTEFQKGLTEVSPRVFFEALRSFDSLKYLMKPLNDLWGIPQTKEYHPEIDTGLHVMMVLDEVCKISSDPLVRFAALCHDFGKGLTPKDELPSHKGHEERGVQPIKDWCRQFRVPKAYEDLAVKMSRFHLHSHKAFELKAGTILKLFEGLDAIRKPQILNDFLLACEADAKGRGGAEGKPYPQAEFLLKLYKAAMAIDTKPLTDKNIEGKKIGDLIRELRIKAIKAQVKRYHLPA